MTLTAARTAVRYLLDEPVAKMWSNDEINAWLNDGLRSMCIRRGIEQIWEDDLVAETDMGLPTDLISLYRVTVEDEAVIDFKPPFAGVLVFNQPQTGTVKVYGTRAPDAATEELGFELPDAFVEGCIDYACWAANQKDEQSPEGMFYWNLFLAKRQEWELSRKFAPTSMTNNWM
jgi:hypothetical protein